MFILGQLVLGITFLIIQGVRVHWSDIHSDMEGYFLVINSVQFLILQSWYLLLFQFSLIISLYISFFLTNLTSLFLSFH